MAFASEDVKLPFSFVEMGTGERIQECGLVEFRLLYEGELLPSGNVGRAAEKHAIRRVFNPQLRRLWSTENNLKALARFSSEAGIA